jgi:hypothetical protein
LTGVVSRDRDDAGRARNARPRDATGRPLARDGVGVAPVDDEITSPADVLVAAQQALDADRPFAAHEYLEGAWHRSLPAERDLWQGLAQVAVGLTHLQRGNVTGARALLERALDRLSAYAGTVPHDIDVDGVRAAAAALLSNPPPTDPKTDLPRFRLTTSLH